MIKSMTGFGKEVLENAARKITIEIRTLNSKQLDLNLRLPQIYREKELDIRSLVGKNIGRGKVDISINIEQKNVASAPVISKELARHYYNELKEVSESINQSNDYDYLSMIVKMPEVLVSPEIEIDEQEYDELLSTIQHACDKVNTFRIHEGKTLEKDFIQRINTITELLKKVGSFEENRTTRIRERIKSNLEAFSQDVQSDKNRFEQEVIYYLEKLDITEEKIRLKKHCDYFLETLSKDSSAGKKLGFVSQEIGREINTMGAKANDFDLQQIVVLMKDELEKIKEQLFNIL